MPTDRNGIAPSVDIVLKSGRLLAVLLGESARTAR